MNQLYRIALLYKIAVNLRLPVYCTYIFENRYRYYMGINPVLYLVYFLILLIIYVHQVFPDLL